MTDYGQMLDTLVKILREAGSLLLSQTVTVDHHKTKNDLLTLNDLWTEEYIIKKLRQNYPEVTIVSEESNPDNGYDSLTVVVDPIDGTCNFAAGMSLFGIQAAIMEGGICRASVLFFPKSGDVLTAILGGGAYFNNSRLKVDPAVTAADSILLISDYYDTIDIPMPTQFALVSAMQKHFLKTRHLGAACVDFACLARGFGSAYITYYHKLWDIAPGLLVAAEAGCVFGALDRASYEYGRPGLVVANSEKTLLLIQSEYRSLTEGRQIK